MDHPVKVVLIGGTGRSGTNVLRARLAEHSDAASLPFESRFAVDPDGVLPTYRALRAGATPFEMHHLLTRLERFLHRLARRSLPDRMAGALHRPLRHIGLQTNLRAYADWELDRHIPDFSRHVAALLKGLRRAEYPAIWPGRPGVLPFARSQISLPTGAALDHIFSEFLTACFDAPGRRAVIDDNTYNLFFAPEWVRLLPGAHLVHVVRDPRDVITSFLHQRWTPHALEKAIAFYDVSMTNLLHNLREIPADRLTILRLEDLADDPAPVMTALYSQIGLTSERQFVPADFGAANCGRWRRDLSGAAQETLNAGAAEWVERFGYEA